MEHSSFPNVAYIRDYVRPPARAAERAAIARGLQEYTHDPEGVIDRNSAPTEDHGTTIAAGRPSIASDPMPNQGRRSLLDWPDTETPSVEGARTTEGETRSGRRFALLRSLAASRQSSTSRRRGNPANDVNDATESAASDRGIVLSNSDSPVNETSSTDSTAHARGPATSDRADAPIRTHRTMDWAVHRGSFSVQLAAANDYLRARASVLSSGHPSMTLLVPTSDGGTAARANPRAGGAPSAGATSTIGGASSARSTPTVGNLFPTSPPRLVGGASRVRGAPAAGLDPAAIPGRRRMGVRPNTARGAQRAGDGPIADGTIPADGALPSVGGVPAVGTMPEIGRVAYVTVQSPDNRFYTVRVDLTNAAPNATYNITINIPPPEDIGQRLVMLNRPQL